VPEVISVQSACPAPLICFGPVLGSKVTLSIEVPETHAICVDPAELSWL
jgi:hypothetical protein